MPPGTALDATDRLTRQAEQIIMADPGFAAVQATVGGGSSESSSITVRVKSSALVEAGRTWLRPKLAFLRGVVLSTQSSRAAAAPASPAAMCSSRSNRRSRSISYRRSPIRS